MEEARKTVAETVSLPQGSYIEWSGQYENEIRARQRLQIVVPVVLIVIYVLLYVTYRSFLEAAHVLLAVPFALSGASISCTPWDTTCRWRSGWASSPCLAQRCKPAVVMVIYLEEAVARKRQELGDG